MIAWSFYVIECLKNKILIHTNTTKHVFTIKIAHTFTKIIFTNMFDRIHVFNFPMFFYYYTILIFLILKWSKKRDSNSQHPTWKAGALPIELFLHLIKLVYRTNKLLENEVVETSSLRCKRNIIAVILIPHIIIVFPISLIIKIKNKTLVGLEPTPSTLTW